MTGAKKKTDQSLATKLIGTGLCDDQRSSSVAPTIQLSSTYAWADVDTPPQIDYGRSGSPVRYHLEQAISNLDGARHALFTNNGMSAIQLLLNLVPVGGKIIAPHDCYGGTYRLLNARAELGHFDVVFVDQTDDASFKKALTSGVNQVWFETPSNPLMRVVDLQKWIEMSMKIGAISIVDHTLLTGLALRPLTLGASIAVQSTTKFVNGHTDCLGGSVSTNDARLYEKLTWWCKATGAGGSPFDSYQTLRGLRTLPLRFEKQQQNCKDIVDWLCSQNFVKELYFTGLPAHPGHAIATRQQKGHGAFFSFEIDGDSSHLNHCLKKRKILRLAPSVGGFESLICTPFTMTHAGMSEEARYRAGIKPALIRVAVGLEDPQDIIEDLERCFGG